MYRTSFFFSTRKPLTVPWVVDEALELAEELASPGGGLLVIDSDPRHGSVDAWIARTNAARLVEDASPEEEPGEDGINVFWEPARYAPEGVEASSPTGLASSPSPSLVGAGSALIADRPGGRASWSGIG